MRNINRQLRAYLPKRSNIKNLSQAELNDIAKELIISPEQDWGSILPRNALIGVANTLMKR